MVKKGHVFKPLMSTPHSFHAGGPPLACRDFHATKAPIQEMICANFKSHRTRSGNSYWQRHKISRPLEFTFALYLFTAGQSINIKSIITLVFEKVSSTLAASGMLYLSLGAIKICYRFQCCFLPNPPPIERHKSY